MARSALIQHVCCFRLCCWLLIDLHGKPRYIKCIILACINSHASSEHCNLVAGPSKTFPSEDQRYRPLRDNPLQSSWHVVLCV